MANKPSSAAEIRVGLPKPHDSLAYAQGCVCAKCMTHQEARDKQYREERIKELNRHAR